MFRFSDILYRLQHFAWVMPFLPALAMVPSATWVGLILVAVLIIMVNTHNAA